MGDLGWAPNVGLGMEAGAGASCSDCLSLLQSKPPRKNSWKQKHAALIQTTYEACKVPQILGKKKMSEVPPLPPIKNPDYASLPRL